MEKPGKNSEIGPLVVVTDDHAAASAFYVGCISLLPADAENLRVDEDRMRNVHEIFDAVGHVVLKEIPQTYRRPAIGAVERNAERLDASGFRWAHFVNQPDVNVIILLADLKRPGAAMLRFWAVGTLGRNSHHRSSAVVGPAVIGALQAPCRDPALRQPRATVQTAVFERHRVPVFVPEEGDPFIEYPQAENAIRLQFLRFSRNVPEIFKVHR